MHAYAAGGHKWLGSPFGLGFLWVHPSLRDELTPGYDGYLNLADPPGGWGHYLSDARRTALDPLPVRSDASVLEPGGTPNWLGAIGLATAIDALLTVGLGTVADRAMALAARLRGELRVRGLAAHLLGDDEPPRQSTIVTFMLPAGPDATRAWTTDLAHRGIAVSYRASANCGGLRVSIHYTNSEDDVDALLHHLDRWL